LLEQTVAVGQADLSQSGIELGSSGQQGMSSDIVMDASEIGLALA
jgi:hypothetical protein